MSGFNNMQKVMTSVSVWLQMANISTDSFLDDTSCTDVPL